MQVKLRTEGLHKTWTNDVAKMGKGTSKLCYNCFTVQEADINKQLVTHSSDADPYEPAVLQTPARLGPGIEHLPASPYEYQAVGLSQRFLERICQPNLEGFVHMIEKDGIKVLSKDTPDGILMWSEYSVPYKPRDLLAFIAKTEKRKLWDSNIAEASKVAQTSSNTYVTYTVYKRFLTISSRDLLLLNTQGQHGEAYYEASSSIEIDEYPITKTHIRANVILAGYYITPITDDSGAEHSKVVNFSESKFGGSLPIGMVKKASASAVPKYVRSLCVALSKDLTHLA